MPSLPLFAGRPIARVVLAAVALLASATVAGAAQLTAEHLVLIVNRNEPRGRELAEFYQKARGVPDGRILELDLPTADSLPRSEYERRVVPVVRRFLLDAQLRGQARCLVTFYGVPLIVGAKSLTDLERRELAGVQADAQALARRLAPLVREAERVAASAGLQPRAWSEGEDRRVEALLARLESAEAALRTGAAGLPAEARATLARDVAALRARMDAPFDADGQALDAAEVAGLLRRSSEAPARGELRDLVRRRGTLRDYAGLLGRHLQTLSVEQSDACFDSELATLWFDDLPAAGWVPNPLARGQRPAEGQPPSVLMVSRLDGRDPQQVRDMIAASVSVERTGLDGSVVIDSRGIAAGKPDGTPDGYGVFDDQLRRLAGYLKQNTALTVVHDDRPEVIAPPGERDVAVYVGWYSLTKYVPAFSFERGAIGYHVASFEMRSLRAPNLPGWVRGLLDDGVVATCGPVSEPYLTAFPPPIEFVPLVLTGEVTLAEAYWATTPLMSWKLGLIGDPLYRPYAERPALRREALPPPLRLRAGL